MTLAELIDALIELDCDERLGDAQVHVETDQQGLVWIVIG